MSQPTLVYLALTTGQLCPLAFLCVLRAFVVIIVFAMIRANDKPAKLLKCNLADFPNGRLLAGVCDKITIN